MRHVLLFLVLAQVACAHPVLQVAVTIPHGQAAYEPAAGDSMRAQLLELMARVRGWGFRLELVENLKDDRGRDAFGLVWHAQRLIQLRAGLSDNAAFEVLTHEVAHVFAPRTLDEFAGEVFAELVMVGVCEYYGYTSTRNPAVYLAAFKQTFPAMPPLKRDIELAIKAATGRARVTVPPRAP